MRSREICDRRGSFRYVVYGIISNHVPIMCFGTGYSLYELWQVTKNICLNRFFYGLFGTYKCLFCMKPSSFDLPISLKRFTSSLTASYFTIYICIHFFLAMGGFLGLTIVYTYAASGEVTEQPIDVAWSCTNLWSGIGILVGPFFSGEYQSPEKCQRHKLVVCLIKTNKRMNEVTFFSYGNKWKTRTRHFEINFT